MAIPKVVWKEKLYDSYGAIQEEAIINQDLKIQFDKKAEELSLTDKIILSILICLEI